MSEKYIFMFPGESLSMIHDDLTNRLFRAEGVASFKAKQYLNEHQMDGIKFYYTIEVKGFSFEEFFDIDEIFSSLNEEYFEQHGEDINNVLNSVSFESRDILLKDLRGVLKSWIEDKIDIFQPTNNRSLYAREGKYQRYMYTLEELHRLPTIERGHTDDLKVFKEKEYKIWLSRSPIHEVIANNIDRVTVEEYHEGKWEVVFSYDPERG